MNISPIRPNFVAEITDIDIPSITDDEFDQLYNAWLPYGVLRIRGQPLDEGELQSFSARFGPLEEIPMGRLPESERAKIRNRYVTQLSNIIQDGKPIGGLGNAPGLLMTTIQEPRKSSKGTNISFACVTNNGCPASGITVSRACAVRASIRLA